MRSFIFLWSERNARHIEKHDVAPDEAEYVLSHAKPPYPRSAGNEKRVVWGTAASGRLLQVVFVEPEIEDVMHDEYEELELHARIALAAGEPAIRVIHARELTHDEKRMLRQTRRGRQ